MSRDVEVCDSPGLKMNGNYKTSASETVLLDGTSNPPVPPDSTQRPRKQEGRRLLWSNVLRVVVIFFVSVLLVLPLVVFYMPKSGVSDQVIFYHAALYKLPNFIIVAKDELHSLVLQAVLSTPTRLYT